MKTKIVTYRVPYVEAKLPWDSVGGGDVLDDIQRAKNKVIMESGVLPDSIYLPSLAESAFFRCIRLRVMTTYRDAYITGRLTMIEGMNLVKISPTLVIAPWKVFVYLASDDELEILATSCIIENAIPTWQEINGDEDKICPNRFRWMAVP